MGGRNFEGGVQRLDRAAVSCVAQKLRDSVDPRVKRVDFEIIAEALGCRFDF